VVMMNPNLLSIKVPPSIHIKEPFCVCVHVAQQSDWPLVLKTSPP
jgi:hypothetical protein